LPFSAIVARIYKCLPGAGHDGGWIVFAGTPADLVAARATLTGEHLTAYVGSGPKAVASR
jgi:excinuclease UvrABC ATPase subunit